MNKISVVILNYKVKKDAFECIKSVKNSDYPARIILVDNDSGDGIEDVAGSLKGVEFIQNKSNLGYTGGNNVGIKTVLRASDYIFIINPDVKVQKDTISKLLETAEKYQAGIVGPKIYFYGANKIWFAGGILDLENVMGSHRGVNEEDKGQYNQIEETDYVSGAAIFVKSEVFEKIGLFDERYFLYYEDSDFCFRADRAGFKIIYEPKAKVFHKNAKSTKLGSPLQDYFMTRNRMLFASKFLSLRTRFALLREALRNIKNPIRRLALWDFLIGNFGKGSING